MTPKSHAELQIEEEISHMTMLVNCTSVKIADAESLIERAIKIMNKCEELRLSRDNWRTKYEELKKSSQNPSKCVGRAIV